MTTPTITPTITPTAAAATIVRDVLPDVTRPDVGTVLVSPWLVGTPERQRAAADATIAAWERIPWPEALISLNCLVGADGTTVLNYEQWTSDEAHQDALDRSGHGVVGQSPEWRRVRSYPGVRRNDDVRRYHLHRSLTKPAGIP
jgi:hypothetical protein